MVIVIVVATVIYIAYSMITSPKDTAFAAYFYNITNGTPADTSLQDGFIEHAGIDTDEHFAYLDVTMFFDLEAQNPESYNQMNKAMAVIYSGELDLIVADTKTIDYYAYGEYIHDVTTILPDDLLDKFKDKLYYASVGENGDKLPVGIYVGDSPKLIQYNYYDKGDPVFSFIINSNSIDNAVEFLRYLYLE